MRFWACCLALMLGGTPAFGKREDFNKRYDEGLRRYAEGDADGALVVFRELLRSDPSNGPARAAVKRLESELAASAAKRRTPPAEDEPRSLGEALDAFLIETLPKCLRFQETLGDALERVGALEALQGRVDQLLMERRLARAHHRRFRKDRELRALVRRMPELSRLA